VQGTAQSLSGLLRSFGPVVAGGVFSLSAAFKFPFLLFILLGKNCLKEFILIFDRFLLWNLLLYNNNYNALGFEEM
jgi:cyanate permease